MKKLMISIGLSVTFSTVCLAQKAETSAEIPAFEINKHYISVGIGAGNFAQAFFRTVVEGSNNTDNNLTFTSIGPLFLKYEYAITDKFGIGVNVATLTNKANYTYTENSTGTDRTYNAELSCLAYSVLARANYHFVNKKIIDPYVGLGLGYRGYRFNYTDNNPDQETGKNTLNRAINNLPIFPLGMELTFGIRVMPTNVVGFYMETGLAKGVIQGGLVAKF